MGHGGLLTCAFVRGCVKARAVLFWYQNAGGEEMDIGETRQTLKRMALSRFCLQEVTPADRTCFQNKAGLTRQEVPRFSYCVKTDWAIPLYIQSIGNTSIFEHLKGCFNEKFKFSTPHFADGGVGKRCCSQIQHICFLKIYYNKKTENKTLNASILILWHHPSYPW